MIILTVPADIARLLVSMVYPGQEALQYYLQEAVTYLRI